MDERPMRRRRDRRARRYRESGSRILGSRLRAGAMPTCLAVVCVLLIQLMRARRFDPGMGGGYAAGSSLISRGNVGVKRP